MSRIVRTDRGYYWRISAELSRVLFCPPASRAARAHRIGSVIHIPTSFFRHLPCPCLTGQSAATPFLCRRHSRFLRAVEWRVLANACSDSCAGEG